MANEMLTPIEGRVLRENLFIPRTTDPVSHQQLPEDKHKYEVWIAFPKGAVWDQYHAHIKGVAARAWPNGEHAYPKFAWKIDDGDGTDSKGRPFPDYCKGHMLVNYSRSAKIGPPQILDNKGDLLPDRSQLYPGCYVKVYGGMDGNQVPGNPGLYLNCDFVYVWRGGERIQSGPDPKAILAGQQAPTPAPTPHPDIMNPPKVYTIDGAQYTAAQLKGFGWTDDQINALG